MSFITAILVGHVINQGRKIYNKRHACLTKENNSSYNKVRWNYYKFQQLSLLQSAMDGYYKLRQLFYYKVRYGLLQIATGSTKCDRFITNCDRYYKAR